MTTTQQPEALRLADKYEVEGFLQDHRFAKDHWCRQAAAELRHQHARIEELEAQLSAIGAGGVEPLRKSAAVPAPNERAAFEAWLGIKPCGAAHDLGWAAWQARAALAATQPAAQGMDARDAARYRWLRDNDWRNDEKMEPVIRLHLNAIWDEKIDAAMAKQGERP